MSKNSGRGFIIESLGWGAKVGGEAGVMRRSFGRALEGAGELGERRWGILVASIKEGVEEIDRGGGLEGIATAVEAIGGNYLKIESVRTEEHKLGHPS